MLTISNLYKMYGESDAESAVVKDVSFSVAAGEFFTLLGPSGCGKSTTLRSIAGLEHPTSGRIEIGGEPVFDSTTGTVTATHKRDFSMVFQSYAVWPHMTVFENVAFPLRVKGHTRADVKARTFEALSMVGLQDAQDRSATMLSGGQQQRVALARAIIKGSKLLLLDEPLSNLDAELRTEMRRELRTLQQDLGITTIYVTHDQDEALSMSDRIALMRAGRIVELDSPENLYLRPKSSFAARFIGQVALHRSEVLGRDGDEIVVRAPFGTKIRTSSIDASIAPADAVELLIRPEHIEIDPLPGELRNDVGDNQAAGRIRDVRFSGKILEADVMIGDYLVKVQALSRQMFSIGDMVRLTFPADRCIIVPIEKTPVPSVAPATVATR